MHVFFSGIGGTAIGPLAQIAKEAGYEVSGSDKQESLYISYLLSKNVGHVHIGQSKEQLASVHQQSPIDWFVYSSAVSIEQPDSPELEFCNERGIRTSKRGEFINHLLDEKKLKMIAVAGTHGKTTTTAMLVWLAQQIKLPLSYSVGAKMNFADMGHYDKTSEYFAYEADEFDRNFLEFHPHISLITGIDYDHHEVFPTKQDYQQAFHDFLAQSQRKFIWQHDALKNLIDIADNYVVLNDDDSLLDKITLAGLVNRRNALQVMRVIHDISDVKIDTLIRHINRFPGLSRRFEKLADNIYSDYAHTIPKIQGCLQLAKELSDNVVVVYEPLTNRRQHYIKQDYTNLFSEVKKLYWVPSYLAREDPEQSVLSPAELIDHLDSSGHAEPAELNDNLWKQIEKHRKNGDLVVCISGGGGGSLDEWARSQLST